MDPVTVELIISGLRIVLPITAELIKGAKSEIEKGNAISVTLTPKAALAHLDSIAASEPWKDLPAPGQPEKKID